jgi:hypothetical protein
MRPCRCRRYNYRPTREQAGTGPRTASVSAMGRQIFVWTSHCLTPTHRPTVQGNDKGFSPVEVGVTPVCGVGHVDWPAAYRLGGRAGDAVTVENCSRTGELPAVSAPPPGGRSGTRRHPQDQKGDHPQPTAGGSFRSASTLAHGSGSLVSGRVRLAVVRSEVAADGGGTGFPVRCVADT